jgi:formate dehydrogenase accessory protein FdhE
MTLQADNKVIEQLSKWEQPYIELYRRLLGLNVEDSYLPTLNAHISKVTERFTQGGFLKFKDLLPDWAEVEKLFKEATSIVIEYSSTAATLNELTKHQLVRRATQAWYYSSPSESENDGETFSLCFQAAIHPILVRYSEALSPLVEQNSWRRRLCPVCGGKPDFAFLNKDNGARWLVCSRCDTEWLFFRLECPFCGNRNQDSLAYFTDENELYRLYTCEQCRTYIKAIDFRRAEDNILFPAERILTLDLDRQAHETEYKPGWLG